MKETDENDLIYRVRMLEKRIEEIEIQLQKEKELLLDDYLKAQGFK